jgi:tRNA(fMet)-specific endonuclease VapC
LFVLDTDACVDLLRRPGATLPAVQALEARGPLMTTAITVQELHEGAHRARQPAAELGRVQRLLAATEVLPHDRATAELAGSIAATLLRKGTPIGDLDTIIAAITLHHRGTLVTRNARHFRQVPDLHVHGL